MKKYICLILLLMLDIIAPVLPVNAEEKTTSQLNDKIVRENTQLYQSEDVEYDVPRIYIITPDGKGNLLKKSDGYIEAEFKIADMNRNVANYSGYIKVRGNSTALVEKKPYTIKLDSQQNLFDMGKAKKWVLLANCLDPTLIRNSIAFNLAKNMNLAYTSKHIVTEVYMDGKFLGSYDLVEPVEAKSNRVNIDTKGHQDFLLEFEKERISADEIYFTVDTWRFRIEEPELPDAEQKNYIESVMTNIVDALKSGDYNQLEQWIDTESFAKYYLVNELLKPVDFGYSSVYVYYKSGKLYAGPVWDYDISMGNANPELSIGYQKATDPTVLFAAEKHFYQYLLNYKEFRQEFIKIYTEYYRYIENIYASDGQIDQLTNQYKTVFDRNFSEAGWNISKSYNIYMRIPAETYQENVDYLRDWLHERNEWLAKYYGVVLLPGDVNADGIFNVSDIVLFQKWLLNVPNIELADWKAADFYSDGKLDVFDLCLMKRELQMNNIN